MAIPSFWTSFGKSIGSIMSALLRDEPHIVVTDCGNGIWEWEICRQGQPLPARMRDGPFKSEEGSPLRLAKSHSASLWSFWNRTGKRCLNTTASVPQTRQVWGLAFWAGSQPGLFDRRKSLTFGLNTLASDDAISWQSSAE